LELSDAHPYTVDLEQCERFTAIFDVRGDGVIRMDEFLDFARFIAIMGYTQSADGRREMAEGLQILEDSRQIEQLIQMLETDRGDIRKVIPYLPIDIQDELLCENFTLSCLKKFKELDVDNSGSLEPRELYPIILEMTSAHSLALDESQCERFTDIFDDARTGVISQQEFVGFARFLMVMSYLSTEEGQQTIELAGARRGPPSVRVPSSPGPQSGSMPSSPQAHLSVDVEYYQQKTEKLSSENSQQRRRLLDMEEKMRVMEERMEMQDNKLRHAAIELSSSK